jgi:hypothetical protein
MYTHTEYPVHQYTSLILTALLVDGPAALIPVTFLTMAKTKLKVYWNDNRCHGCSSVDSFLLVKMAYSIHHHKYSWFI